MPYEILIKIFEILYNTKEILGNDLLQTLIEGFFEHFNEHKEKNACEKNCEIECYCLDFSQEDLFLQSREFIEKVKYLRNHISFSKGKMLQRTFPLFYSYIEHFILSNINKQKEKNSNYSCFLLTLVFFYNLFENNFSKSLFYLWEFMRTKSYKTSKILQFQIELIKYQLHQDYKKYVLSKSDKEGISASHFSIKDNTFLEIYKKYQGLIKEINLEKKMIDVINSYKDSLLLLSENECSMSKMKKHLTKFNLKINNLNRHLIYLFGTKVLNNYHLCSKSTLFYNFFYSKEPPSISSCYQNIFEHNCKCDNFSTLIVTLFLTKERWKFSLEYASDDFCSKLGYQLKFLKGIEFGELFPHSLRKCFEYFILKNIQMGNIQIVIKEIVILDKYYYAHIFNMVGIIIFTGNVLKLFLKVYSHNYNETLIKAKVMNKKESIKKKQKVNNCFAIVNKFGKFIAISEDFEKYFSLNLNIIKKYKINIFQDILKIQSISGKEKIMKNLNEIYENISELNFSLMQNSSNDEFALTYKNIKSIQHQIQKKKKKINIVCELVEKIMNKSKKAQKIYYTLNFTIEVDNLSTSLGKYLKKEISEFPIASLKSLKNIASITKKKTIKKKINSLGIKKQFGLNKNKYDTYLRIRQIQILSFKYLFQTYKLKTTDILSISPAEEKEIKNFENSLKKDSGNVTSISSASTSHMININVNSSMNSVKVTKFFHLPGESSSFLFDELLSKQSIFNRLKRKLIILLVFWVFFSLSFIFFQTIIMIIDSKNDKNLAIINNLLINSLLIRNVLYSSMSSITRMQLIVNGVQPGNFLNNKMNNTLEFHKEKLTKRINNFLELYINWEKNLIQSINNNVDNIVKLFRENANYTVLNSQNFCQEFSLYSTLNYIHFRLLPLIEQKISPFSFNETYINIKNREFLQGESSSFFVMENYLTVMKYFWDELDNLFLIKIRENKDYIILFHYSINFSNGMLLFVIFMIEAFVYMRINNQIYAKFYYNYSYIQFFNNFLLAKIKIISNFLENSDIENVQQFSKNKLSLINVTEDSQTFYENYKRLNNKLPILITSYKVKESEPVGLPITSKDSFISFIDRIPYNIQEDLDSYAIKKEKCERPSKKYQNNLQNFTKNSLNVPEPQISLANFQFQNLNLILQATKLKSQNFPQKSTLISEKEIINHQKKFKKPLKNPSHFLGQLIAFALACLSIFIVCIINGILFEAKVKIRYDFSQLIKYILQTTTNSQEIMLLYTTTLMKNKELLYSYHSHGFLSILPSTNYLNEIIEHNIFKETIEVNFIINNFIKNQILNHNKRYKMLYEYFKNINSDDSCEYYIEFYYANINNSQYSTLGFSFSEFKENLIKECNQIGKGINSKGQKIAIDSLIKSIQYYHQDFISNPEKTSDIMLKRMNDEIYNIFQLEVDLLLDKTMINYLICWEKDFRIIQKEKKRNSNIFFVSIGCLALILNIFYILKFTCMFLEYNFIINDIEPLIFNTILF